MMTEAMIRDLWAERRTPLEGAAAEDARTAAYWTWIDSQPAGGIRANPLVQDDDFAWVRNATPQKADFEARNMRHSIGHSFDKYRRMGQLFPLRAADGTPVVTVLEVSGRVVRGREHQNTRLRPEAMLRLDRFAARMGFGVVPDSLPFVVWADPHVPEPSSGFAGAVV